MQRLQCWCYFDRGYILISNIPHFKAVLSLQYWDSGMDSKIQCEWSKVAAYAHCEALLSCCHSSLILLNTYSVFGISSFWIIARKHKALQSKPCNPFFFKYIFFHLFSLYYRRQWRGRQKPWGEECGEDMHQTHYKIIWRYHSNNDDRSRSILSCHCQKHWCTKKQPKIRLLRNFFNRLFSAFIFTDKNNNGSWFFVKIF